MALRLLIADDQAAFRDGIRAMLAVVPDIDVVGEASTGLEARRLACALRPDVVLMDLRMPVMDGVEATGHVRREVPTCRVVALTTFADDELVFGAIRAGAAAYLLKGADTPTLLGAIRGDGTALSPAVSAKVVSELRRLALMQPPSVAAPTSLSLREIEVVRLLAVGSTNKEIALALGLAEGTVKNHVTHVLEKLSVGDRTQAALRARELGLL